MPFELEPDEVVVAAAPPEPLDEPEPPEELDGWLDCVLAFVEEPELEELEPQAASPSAASTSSPAISRRGDLISVVFMVRSLFEPGEVPVYDLDAVDSGLVPGR